MNIIREKVDYLLAVQALTQAELAVRSGISPQSLSAVLRRGTCEPRTAGRLAAGLGVPVQEIIGEGRG